MSSRSARTPASPIATARRSLRSPTFMPPQPGTPVNPVGLAYVPDHIEVAADGTLLLLDKETQSVFRWDPDTQQYGATIPLVDVPRYMAYSPVTNTMYVAYASGLINKINLGSQTTVEEPFAMLPSPTRRARHGGAVRIRRR